MPKANKLNKVIKAFQNNAGVRLPKGEGDVSFSESDARFGINPDNKYATLDRMNADYAASKDKSKSRTELGKPYDRSIYTKFDNKEFITAWSTEHPSSPTYQVPKGSTNTAKAERGKTASRQKGVDKRAIDKASKPKKLY